MSRTTKAVVLGFRVTATGLGAAGIWIDVSVGLAAALPPAEAAGLALAAADDAGSGLAAPDEAGLALATLAAALAGAALEAAAGLLAGALTDAAEALGGALTVAAEPPQAESASVPMRTRSEYDLMLPPCFWVQA